MQNPCSIEIFVRLTHLKDLEETISSFRFLCFVLALNSGHLRLLISLGCKPKGNSLDKSRLFKKVLELL